MLDIGAGYCELINQIRARRRIAIDLNPDTVLVAEPGVEVLSIPLEQISAAIEPESVDLAFASNVFEHLRGPDALLEVLEAIHRILKPGGRLIVMQPNVTPLGGRFWDFVDHTLPLTEKGMAEALEVSRFEVVECRGSGSCPTRSIHDSRHGRGWFDCTWHCRRPSGSSVNRCSWWRSAQ